MFLAAGHTGRGLWAGERGPGGPLPNTCTAAHASLWGPIPAGSEAQLAAPSAGWPGSCTPTAELAPLRDPPGQSRPPGPWPLAPGRVGGCPCLPEKRETALAGLTPCAPSVGGGGWGACLSGRTDLCCGFTGKAVAEGGRGHHGNLGLWEQVGWWAAGNPGLPPAPPTPAPSREAL